MNKAELVQSMAEKSGLSKTDAKKALEAFILSVEASLQSGEKISLVGFGTFSVIEKAARTGINPSTKKTIRIPAKRVVKFKAGKELAEKVN